MPVLVATLTPEAGKMDEVEAVLKELIPAVHDEDGCEMYALHRAKDKFVFVEKWRDGDALAAHAQGPSIKALNERLAGLLATGGGEILMLQPVPVGDPQKGAV